MLFFEQLSFWERQQYIENNTFVIIGAGIVGMSTALSLHERFPKEKILIIERGYLPTGASTKNAGFTCFGSPTELIDDINLIGEDKMWQTVALRLEGLALLKKRISKREMELKESGSWDLISANQSLIDKDILDYLNKEFLLQFGLKDVYSIDNQIIAQSKFFGIKEACKNQYEGSVNPGKLMHALYHKCISAKIQFLFATEMLEWTSSANEVNILTNFGELKAKQMFLCTNGFASKYFSQELKPARAQVLVTKPLRHSISGTFHSDRGYYYFRDIGNCILIGGGRNLDFHGETTTKFEKNQRIRQAILDKLTHELLPNQPFEIAYEWSGIMGVGSEKTPLIRSLNKNVHAGVRMGGMGLAIGSAVGAELSKLA